MLAQKKTLINSGCYYVKIKMQGLSGEEMIHRTNKKKLKRMYSVRNT
jgi:hypothetical protein